LKDKVEFLPTSRKKKKRKEEKRGAGEKFGRARKQERAKRTLQPDSKGEKNPRI